MDIILIPVILIVMAFAVFFATFLYNQVKDTELFPGNETTNPHSTQVKASIQQTVDLFPYMFVMVLVSIFVTLLVSAYFIPSSPIFLIAGIIIIFVGVIVAVQMANAWETVYDDPSFADMKDDQEVLDIIMDMLPLITFVAGSLFLMVLYGKKGQTGGYEA